MRSTFLLTRPSRDVTLMQQKRMMPLRFLLTRPSRDVTTQYLFLAIFRKFLLTRPSRDVTFTCECLNITCGFLLTRPSRDVTNSGYLDTLDEYISTHTSLAGRDSRRWHPENCMWISTHTSLAGRDSGSLRFSVSCDRNFYSHVPRGT